MSAEYLAQQAQRVETTLERLVRNSDSPYAEAPSAGATERLFEAMRYALLGGGKRLRPALFFASYEALDGATIEPADQDRIACALECLHAYSLVHDDLPVMDDDDLRRGRPSCHRAFDEATAVLAGDALQALGFELLCGCESIAPQRRIAMLAELSRAVGGLGMVGGQAIDLAVVAQQPSSAALETMHRLKTGALIRAAVRLAVLGRGAAQAQAAALDAYASAIGLAFQLRDDLLDVEQSTAVLGKTAGADQARNKPTAVSVSGVAATRARLEQLLGEARQSLRDVGLEQTPLAQLADYVVERGH